MPGDTKWYAKPYYWTIHGNCGGCVGVGYCNVTYHYTDWSYIR